MFNKLNAFTAWFIVDPRRATAVLFIIIVALLIATALVPGAEVLAGEATSGS
ncbi:MAG TPA: hypothetical protein VHP83_05475 [Aggregatilineaceae bacterium]|nr:hypothetical protein [Aggregatilineaceae bacterium]